MKHSSIILYQSDDGQIKLDVTFENETVWLTQEQMASLFQRDVSVISRHISAVFTEGELDKKSNLQKMQFPNSDKPVNLYSLDVIISVGYRVKSVQGTRFRIWATKRLNEYIRKGFTLNDELLKQAGGGNYFDELLDRIRDIRSSERVFWRKVLDIFATSIDYSPNTMPKHFFELVQNKMHWAAHGHTAAEVIMLRADASKPNMGLTVTKNKHLRKADIGTAKNYLQKDELDALNLLVSSFLDIAELQARRRIPMKMQDWINTLDSFLKMSRSNILSDYGKVSKELAMKKANLEYEKYKNLTDDELSGIEEQYIKYLGEAESRISRKQ